MLISARSEVAELLNKIDSAGKIEELKNFLNEYKKRISATNQNSNSN